MTKTKNKRPNKPLLSETYLSAIKNSIGAKIFRNFFARVNGKKNDLLKNGELSCAIFVSSLLKIFQLIKNVHTTVDSTVKDLNDSGWKKIKKPKTGCILIWEEKLFGLKKHKHIGFYYGNNSAVSNSAKLRCPAKHHWTFNNTRRVEAMFWNKKLG